MRTQQIKSLLLTNEFAITSDFLEGILSSVNEGVEKIETINDISPSHSYETKNNVAIISVDGAMTKKNTWINAICGGFASYDVLSKYIEKAENDERIDTILFNIDTPGGMVAGADEVGEQIFSSSKKTVTFYNNMGASAGMWIFSGSSKRYASETTVLGSVGVIVTYRKREKEKDIITLLSKRAENKASDDDKKIQARIDEIEDIFYSRLERNTKMSKDMIQKGFNNGDVISASEAKKIGFIEDITSFDTLLKSLVNNKPLAAMPSENEKIVNSNIGATMEFSNENFNVLLEQNKVLSANRDTLSARNETLKVQLEEATTALDTKIVEMSALNENLKDMEAKLSEVVAKTEDAETRVREAFACNVDADTAISMLKANDALEASKLANDFRSSNGASGQSDANFKAQEDPWAEFNFKR